jgi:hypothetical protein
MIYGHPNDLDGVPDSTRHAMTIGAARYIPKRMIGPDYTGGPTERVSPGRASDIAGLLRNAVGHAIAGWKLDSASPGRDPHSQYPQGGSEISEHPVKHPAYPRVFSPTDGTRVAPGRAHSADFNDAGARRARGDHPWKP